MKAENKKLRKEEKIWSISKFERERKKVKRVWWGIQKRKLL